MSKSFEEKKAEAEAFWNKWLEGKKDTWFRIILFHYYCFKYKFDNEDRVVYAISTPIFLAIWGYVLVVWYHGILLLLSVILHGMCCLATEISPYDSYSISKFEKEGKNILLDKIWFYHEDHNGTSCRFPSGL